MEIPRCGWRGAVGRLASVPWRGCCKAGGTRGRGKPGMQGGERLLLGGRGAAATDRHFHGMRLTLQEEGRQRMWGRPMATELGGSFCLNACFF